MVLPHPAVMIQITKTSGRLQQPETLAYNIAAAAGTEGNKMTISKKLQKILALTLMTSFLSTSFLMGVSEAASARHNGGGRPPAHARQIQRETQRGPSVHQMKAPMQKHSSGHQARPAVHKSAPAHQGYGMHKGGPGHQVQPMMHKSGSIHHGSPTMHRGGSIYHGGPTMHRGGSIYHGSPMMHRGGSIYHGGPMMHRGGPIVHRSEPVFHHRPAPPPPHHRHHDDHRSMHSGEWIGALIVGGVLGAIIANKTHPANRPDYVEYAD